MNINIVNNLPCGFTAQTNILMRIGDDAFEELFDGIHTNVAFTIDNFIQVSKTIQTYKGETQKRIARLLLRYLLDESIITGVPYVRRITCSTWELI